MKCLKKITIYGLIVLSIEGHAGIVAPTAHSRANCGGFNESITWQLGHAYLWRVESHHFFSISDVKPRHVINTGRKTTWRAAAYHATEGYSTRGDHWFVAGYHFYYPNGREVLDVTTMANDCSIYDG